MDSESTSPATFNPQELNQALVCILCFGYFRNAHTVKECLHTFCKSCIYKHFNENMDCPHCGKDLQPFPFSMIRPDPVLQSIVEKLFPEAVEADYEAEQAFYKKRNLPLPEHLKERNLHLAARTAEDLDLSLAAASEADSELPSEPPSANVSIIEPDNAPDTKISLPDGATLLPDSIEPPKPSSMDTEADFSALDHKIDAALEENTPSSETSPSAPPSDQNHMDVS